MNTVKGARAKWTEVFEDPNLSMASLRARALNQSTNVGIDGIRSVCWKFTWPTFSSLPDNDYFRSEKVQEQLCDILFIYCKINHDVSYRQGMHELAAYFLWVVSNDSLDVTAEGNVGTMDPSCEVMKSVLDSNYIEHDTFSLFSSLMQHAKPWYEFSDEGFGAKRRAKPNNSTQTQLFGRPEAPEPAEKQTPVIEWSMKIFHHLERIDNELFRHLVSLEIQPQLFGIRWFRLLFGREFPMEDVLNLWDGIFAKDPSLNIVVFIGLALLLRIRDDLLEGDFSGCLHKLMRYPSVKDTHLFISQALRLQSLPNAAGGQEIIRQNNALAGKPLPPIPSLETPSSPQQKLGRHSPLPNTSHHYNHSNQYPQQHQYQQNYQQHPSQHGNGTDKNHHVSFPGNGVLSQHLPPAALDAIKPVAEGFVHVTKNVLESKGGAALNKAIHDMKKNTQTYIRKASTNTSNPQPASPNFPPMFDQAINSTGRLAASSRPAPSPPLQPSHTSIGSKPISKGDKQLQPQLGQVVAKSLLILESHFSAKTLVARADGAGDAVEGPPKEVVAALNGLEHVRDILLGLTKDLDPLVIASKTLDTYTTASPQAERKASKQTTDDNVLRAANHNDSTGRTAGETGAEAPKAVRAVDSTLSGSPNSPKQGETQRRSVPHKVVGQVSSGASQEYRFNAGDKINAGPHVHSSPVLVPTQAPSPIKSSQPFSFDDLVNDTGDTQANHATTAGERKKANTGSSGALANTKSPRSSLANSQFSWMLDDKADRDGLGRLSGASGSSLSTSSSSLASSVKGAGTGGSRPSGESFSPSSASTRMKLDPLAGSVSQRTGSFGRAPGVSSAQDHQEIQGDDPLRA
ncbi:hypothetical protein BGZ94_008393 [Podila epigama]|nr:hypothetical protein BGZ94_008393 [Podila epigama]